MADFLQSVQEGLIGTPERAVQVPNYTPDQVKSLDALRSLGQQGVQQGLGKNFAALGAVPSFDPIKQQAIERFQTEVVPTLMQRLNAIGSSPSSSASLGAISNAERGLGRDLAALESQYGLQRYGLESQRTAYNNQQQMRQNEFYKALFSMGLSPQFSNFHTQAQSGIVQNSLPGLIKLLGSWFGLI